MYKLTLIEQQELANAQQDKVAHKLPDKRQKIIVHLLHHLLTTQNAILSQNT